MAVRQIHRYWMSLLSASFLPRRMCMGQSDSIVWHGEAAQDKKEEDALMRERIGVCA